MTATDFINNGYRVSEHLDQKEVDAAVANARSCYADKVVVGLDLTDTDYAAAVMAVAYILLVRRSTVATRAGGKEKLSPMQSQTADVRTVDVEKADTLLAKLQTKPGGIPGNVSQLVDDIARIYFRNVFLGL